MNPNLDISDPGFKLSFKLMTYNVDQAMREEKYEDTKWNNRYGRVRALIEEVDADIVCLQELRKLPDSKLTTNEFLASLRAYNYVVDYRNPSPLSFGQAILYKPDRFFARGHQVDWLSDTPHVPSDTWSSKPGGSTGFGYIVSGLRLQPVKEARSVWEQPCFWVFNTHFGMEEDLKTRSARKLLEIVHGKVDSCGEAFLVCGDFNFFPDKDAATQRSILTSCWSDLGRGACTLGGKLVEGTFVGYEHDEFKADVTNMKSRLDHIFASRRFGKEGPVVLYTKTMTTPEPEELTRRNLLPSDHLPLVANIIDVDK